MIRAFVTPAFLVLALLGAGCQTPPSAPPPLAPLVARFYLETKPSDAGVPVKLPQSGLIITVAPKPVLVEYDIVNAEIAQVELGRCLLVQVSPAAARDLYRLTVSAVGRRLLLALNDQFVGARPIEAALDDGVVLIFLEMPDDQLPALVARLKLTSANLAAAAHEARKP